MARDTLRVVQRLVSTLVPGERSRCVKQVELASHPTDNNDDGEPSEFARLAASEETATQVRSAGRASAPLGRAC